MWLWGTATFFDSWFSLGKENYEFSEEATYCMLDCSLACTVLISTAYAVQTRSSLQILLACDLDYSCSLRVLMLKRYYWSTGSQVLS